MRVRQRQFRPERDTANLLQCVKYREKFALLPGLLRMVTRYIGQYQRNPGAVVVLS
ncbi:hypothetical protein [Arthrobacter psychrochitiniphilus]|uniref:hypothetical protein n=1 Tax=Arthrobacter psychrochitiniphilus TaxID=291045 RepID=UPI003F7CCC40